jgi:hypothetical protein
MRQVAQVVLEGGETGDDFSIDPEGGHAVRDALLGFGDDPKDRLAQFLQGSALRLFYFRKVAVHFLG